MTGGTHGHDDIEVRAAGGVVWRPGSDGPQVLIVHRPRYDDWSLPKGKLDDGEDFADAALREVREETGVVGVLGPDLGEIRYRDHKDRSKIVRWWAVRAEDVQEATDLDEVDQQEWLDVTEAISRLTYPTDVEVVARFRASVAG